MIQNIEDYKIENIKRLVMGEAVSNSLPLNIVSLFIPVLFYFLGLNSNLEEFKILFSEKK